MSAIVAPRQLFFAASTGIRTGVYHPLERTGGISCLRALRLFELTSL